MCAAQVGGEGTGGCASGEEAEVTTYILVFTCLCLHFLLFDCIVLACSCVYMFFGLIVQCLHVLVFACCV